MRTGRSFQVLLGSFLGVLATLGEPKSHEVFFFGGLGMSALLGLSLLGDKLES